MKKLAITSTTSILFLFNMFLMPGNGWAVSSYAQKFGMGCKSCHAFGSELNSLGKSFKKNGYSFGEKNAEQKDSLKPGTPKNEKSAVSKTSAATPDTSGTLNNGREGGPADVFATSDAEQPLPEAKFFTWKSDDGTFHFSDRAYVNPRSEKKPVSSRFGKKDRGPKPRPLSAIVPKRLQNQAMHTVISKPEKTASQIPGSPESFVAEKIIIKPKNFEDCMEQFFVSYPPPKTSASAMEQFREAETICAPYQKEP